MTDVEITLTLPAEMAEKARDAGLLDSSHFLNYLETELRRKAALADLKAMVDTLRTEPVLMTEEEIDAELALAKAERIAKTESKQDARKWLRATIISHTARKPRPRKVDATRVEAKQKKS